ncbi:ABC transporter permease [Gordonia polyisoprenivorans]|uniref:ABC transporter permease n=1 Tax=Gordonia polyisoprenivorans TaxID=84595 RepID=UPI001AD6F037|nr:ABC transporter permease [Gordonia polyisoprenivorans]QTI71302.1 ABC transporter permease [Gordonia polyisoprenivorans]
MSIAEAIGVPDTDDETPQPRTSPAQVARTTAVKLASAIFVLWGAVTVTFIVLSVLPGNRAAIVLNVQSGLTTTRTDTEIAAVNAQYGWDRPLIVQYFSYLGNLLRGDLGTSWELRRPVTEIIGEQVGPTLTLTISALILAWVLSVPWTLLTAGRGRRVKTLGSTVETITAGLPQYWLGVILLIVFAVNLGWFPVIGGVDVSGTVLPAFTLAIPLAGFIGQATRTEFDRAIRQPFVLSARTRGMSENGVRLRHVLRHALIPGITLSGWAMGALLSGAVLVESVFARPGLGAVLVKSVSDKDFELVMGLVILISAVYVAVNLLIDVIYTIVDPRLGGSR